ncbi:tRNA 4-thiouridine(8) synthase ThiI [Candidatus Bathyarchaeota archaeon RBG_13_52_12]|nr:MAG: tRNA 4-thiouridine(8) synthase ThiI [Candidatus Bathyarchaeota archaeon RBG_13_52_12]
MPILAAYNEIALKSRYVRATLERKLATQIDYTLKKGGYNEAKSRRQFGRIIVDGVPPEAAGIVAKVFGVVHAIPSMEASSGLDEVVSLAVDVADHSLKEGNSFAVRPKVVGEHPYGSRDVAVKAGAAILEAYKNRGVRVNLTSPDVTIGIEVRDKNSYIYSAVVNGVGGLPYGSQGRAVSLFSGGIDSPVATWLTMKRGVEVYPLFMDQTPYVGESYLRRAEEASRSMIKYVPVEGFSLYSAPMGFIMERILESPEPRFTCILCKRSMYRIAEEFSRYKKAKAIVTGESLGQVASQTLDNLYVLDSAVTMPVLRPLIGLDKVEIENRARVIGTYSLTAHRVEGCKAVPSKPATTSRIEKIEALETQLGLADLCCESAKKIIRLRLG